MPDVRLVTWAYLQQLLTKEKTPVFLCSVGKPWVPVWPELAVPKIWPFAIKNPRVAKRMPDEWMSNGGRRADRTWFWKVLFAVDPPFAQQIIESCQSQRRARKVVKPQRPSIPVDQERLEMLVSGDIPSHGKYLPRVGV